MSSDPSPDTLVSLLADEAAATRAAVRRALVDLGSTAIPALRRATDGDNPVLRARARQVLIDLRRERGYALLSVQLAGHDIALEDGLLAIDEFLGAADPALDVGGRLDAWSARVRSLAAGEHDSATGAAALRSVLGVEEGLIGPESDFHNVDHVSLTRTMETRHGLPLTLCAIYALVARRAGLTAALLPFPGQVLLQVEGEDERRILDPFSGGVEVSDAACLARLCAVGASPSPHWLEPATDRSMVIRQIRNLGAAMERHDRVREAGHLARLLRDA